MWYIDGDGVSSLPELLDRWREAERVEDPTVAACASVESAGVPVDRTASDTLAGLLAARFDDAEVVSLLRAARVE